MICDNVNKITCPFSAAGSISYCVKKSSNALPFRNKLCYGVGGLGYNSLGQTIGSFLMFFCTSIMGLSGTLVGLAIGIASLWDGISDPLVGHISDRAKNGPFGKRLKFMIVAIFLIGICNTLLWSMPKSSQGVMFAWLLIFLLLLETANTFWSTPYSALALDIAPDYNEQSKIQSYKTVFNIIGMILPSILMFFIMPSVSLGTGAAEASQGGFIKMAVINSALMLGLGLITIFGSLKRVRTHVKYAKAPAEKHSFKKLLLGYFEVFKHPGFACIIAGYSIAQIASSFLTSVGMHLFTYCYHFSTAQISILLVLLFAGAIVSQPFWVALSKRIDKKGALISALSLLLLGIGLTLISFLFRQYVPIETLYYFVIVCIFVCGLGLGAMQSLPISMYADVVTLEQYKTGVNKAGAYLGYYSFTYNLSNSISLLIIGILLDAIKFNSAEPVQAMSVQTGLGTIVFCGCSIALAAAILIFSRYKVKRADVLKAQLKIAEQLKNDENE